MASPSTFAERFLFAREFQRFFGEWIDDGELASRLGFKSQSEISSYKKRSDPPHAGRILVVAKLCGVDPGWLAFGTDSGAPEPSTFPDWIAKRRAAIERPDIPGTRNSSTVPKGLRRDENDEQGA